jgi:hypothetical protein
VSSWLLESLVAIALALPVHECGHLLAARMCGARDVRLSRNGWLGAAVHATFVSDARGPRAWFFAAGALANVAIAVTALALDAGAFAGIHGAFAVLMLVPTRDSDGARLLSLVGARR